MQRDWLTVLVARREELLRALAEELDGEYEVCDVGDREAVERMAAAVTERHPAIGMLVNNAGMPGRGDFTTLDPERIERVTDVNYLGTVWCTRAFLPALEAGRPVAHREHRVRGRHGCLGPGRAVRGVQARRSSAFSRGLTGQLAPRGISVHTVNPGFVESETFPQRGVLRNPLLEWAVIDPPDVAGAVMRAVDRNRREIFVPRWYRVAAIAQAVVPGLLARFARR